MILRPPGSTPAGPIFPDTTLFRSQRVCNGPFSGFKCTAVTFGFAGAHHRLAHFPHDRTDVGEVEVDEARHNHQVSDTANTLLQHFVSKDRKSTRLNSSP